MYHFNPESRGTENNLVRPLEPVIFMVSEKAYDSLDPGYDNGKYDLIGNAFMGEINKQNIKYMNFCGV